MTCFRCGSEVPEDQRFCGNCGAPVTDTEHDTLVLAPAAEDLLERVQRIFSGDYEVQGELGRGGMGVVFKATESGLSRPVALKVLPPDVAVSGPTVERFKREARLVAELDHPNIIPVYRAGQTGGILHIAMRYVEGRTIDSIITQQGPLPVPVVLATLRSATRALAHAHDRDIVHRDVKGANILVDTQGRVMVSDFGLALRATDVSLTTAGTLVGTPAYMSPEQCAGRRALPQSDQYSLGIVTFEMLAGDVPFRSETLEGLIQHHFFTPPPDLRAVRDDLPEPLIAIVERVLRKDPQHRFATTRDMLAAVEAIPFGEEERSASEEALRALVRAEALAAIQARPLPPPPETPTLLVAPPLPRRRAARRVPWPAVAGVAAAAVIAGVLWLPTSTGTPPTAAADTGTQTAVVPAAETTSRALLPNGSAPAPGSAFLRINPVPTNAEVLVDGRVVGTGTLMDVRVAPGTRRVQARAPGYGVYDTVVVFQAGVTTNLRQVSLPEPQQ